MLVLRRALRAWVERLLSRRSYHYPWRARADFLHFFIPLLAAPFSRIRRLLLSAILLRTCVPLHSQSEPLLRKANLPQRVRRRTRGVITRYKCFILLLPASCAGMLSQTFPEEHYCKEKSAAGVEFKRTAIILSLHQVCQGLTVAFKFSINVRTRFYGMQKSKARRAAREKHISTTKRDVEHAMTETLYLSIDRY